MKIYTYTLILISISIFSQRNNKHKTFFEKANGNQSANYLETIDFYSLLANDFPTIKMQEMGLTDSELPLHIVMYNPEKKLILNKFRKAKP